MSALEIAALKVRKDYYILNDGVAQCGHSIKAMFHNVRWAAKRLAAPMAWISGLPFAEVDGGSQVLDFGHLVVVIHEEPMTNCSLLSGHRSVLNR